MKCADGGNMSFLQIREIHLPSMLSWASGANDSLLAGMAQRLGPLPIKHGGVKEGLGQPQHFLSALYIVKLIFLHGYLTIGFIIFYLRFFISYKISYKIFCPTRLTAI